MIVALSVLAVLMLIGGLAAMVQGIPFIRLEVGWTMVIAGTVGASAGAVLLGITAAVARLGRIERALAGRAAERAVPERSLSERAAPIPAFVDPAASETGAAPIRALRGEPALPSVLPPIPFPAVTPPAPEPRPAEPTGHDGGAALAVGAAGLAAGLAASELRLTRAEDSDPPARPEEPTHPAPMHHEEPAHHEPAQRETEAYAPVEEPRFEVRATHEEPAPPPVPQAVEPPAPPPPAEPVPQRPEEEFLPEEPPGKTVIGTYDSGGNTYTMFADGTIEAETPAGRFHFASIDELKTFRSAGGEGAARSA